MSSELRMRSQFDISEVSQTYLDSPNYKVIDLNSKSNLCVIYFSSNGLYHPNTSYVFHQIISVRDRYEWKRNIVKSARKVILVRDVQKQWYLEGINAGVNSIEKLAQLLKNESQDLDTICVGNSAGGYAAVIFGCLIKASHIFSFSGQFSLQHQLSSKSVRAENPTLVKYENIQSYRQYYSLVELIKKSKIPIVYFYPAKSAKDIEQSKLVREISHVYSFAFNQKHHADTCWRLNFVDLLQMDLPNLVKLHQSFQGRNISPYIFSNRVSGYVKTFKYLIQSCLKKLLKSSKSWLNS